MKPIISTILVLLSLAASSHGDSIFDARGLGRDVIPAVGGTRALAGAVAASKDPLLSSITCPCASAVADMVTITAGFADVRTNSSNLGEEHTTITSLFPSISVVVPLKRISLLTGLFLEKEGRLSLYQSGIYANTIYDGDYRRESSIHSVPIFVSGTVNRNLIVSAGLVISFLDTREKTVIDFRSDEYLDTEDVFDMYGQGESIAAGALLDLGRIRLSGLFRTGSEIDGTLQKENKAGGIWSSESIDISSQESFRLGLWVEPVDYLALEVDFDRTPWSQVAVAGSAISSGPVERFAVGLQYRGDHIWPASKFPLNMGYYRQPLDWETPLTGEIVEQMFSLGTSFPMAQARAAVSVSFEIGRRRSEVSSDLEETVLGFALSMSAIEAWRREIRR